MRHQRLRRKLGVKTAHRKALLRNLVKSLVIRKRIHTTFAKAKEASAFADQMVQLAKRGGDLHARRLLIAKLGCSGTAHTLITQIAPHFRERNGGYTRVLRLGTRIGDGAQTALLEFSTLIEVPEKAKKPKKEKKTKDVKHEEPPSEKSLPAGGPGKKEMTKEELETKKPEKKKAPPAKEEAGKEEKKEDKKESEKKGGFLSALRKFLKGDE